jgi:hypothetical protein
MSTNDDDLPVGRPDELLENADWTKQSWDLPPYKSEEFFRAIGGPKELDDFRESEAYQQAVEKGLIHDDEWVADYVEESANG